MEGRVILINRSAESLLGASAEEMFQRPIQELIPEEAFGRQLSLIRQEEGGETIDLGLLDRGRGEMRTFEVGTSLVQSTGGQTSGVITILRDVTRERESDRLKNEFISTAAHELSTPLASMMGYAELLLEHGGEGIRDEQQREFLTTIFEKGESLSKIVDHLLQLSRIEKGRALLLEKSRCNLAELVRTTVEQYRGEALGRRFESALPEQSLEVEADCGKIALVLDNLLSNAVKFSSEGGRIRVLAQWQEGCVCIVVEDDGVGMTSSQVERAFEKFYRVDSSTTAVAGFGLGLTIARNIVKAHGGQIRLESEPGRGTKAIFTLPATPS